MNFYVSVLPYYPDTRCCTNSKPTSYLQRTQDGAGGVHEEKTQVTQDVCKGEETLGHQDGMEGVPVLSFHLWYIFALREMRTSLQKFEHIYSHFLYKTTIQTTKLFFFFSTRRTP